jgi:hypothetical protein
MSAPEHPARESTAAAAPDREHKPQVRPGGPANPAQHLVGDESGGPSERPQRPLPEGQPTNADPHPSTEEGYGRKSKVEEKGL